MIRLSLPLVQRVLSLLIFFISLTALGQYDSSVALISIQYTGSLSGYLDIITEQTDVRFSYKSKIIKKKRISITTKCNTVDDVLLEIKRQCALDNNKVGLNAITLYPAKGEYIIGTLREIGSLERIADAVIQTSEATISSDKEGNFRLFCLLDSVDVIVYHPDFQISRTKLYTASHNQFFIYLQPITSLEVVNVVSTDSVKLNTLSFDKVEPTSKQVIAIGGESDALAHIKLIPGVHNVSFGQQGLTIRGGSPDQNFTLLDGIPVYNTYHMLGLFSIFNSSSVSSIKLHKDAFPAKYANRLSSVIDVSLKNGNKQKTELEADIGILSSGIYLNGPLIKNKLSYTFSARRTYADLLTLPLQKAITSSSTTLLWSYDLMAKMHWQINESNELSISGYNGGDQLDFRTQLSFDNKDIGEEKTKGSLGWRNEVLGLKWISRWSSRVEIHSDLSYSGYNLKFSDEYELEDDSNFIFNSSSYTNGLQEVRGGVDAIVLWNKNNSLNIGVGVVEYLFLPFQRGYSSITANTFTDTNLVSRQIASGEQFAFLENKTYFKGGNITYGLRVSSFGTDSSNYLRFQPKIHLIQNIKEKHQLRFSMTVSNQFIHLVPNNNLGLPVDIWLPVTNTLKPMEMTQFSTKYVLKNKNWEFESGVFSKFYSNILEHESGAQLLSEANWEDNLRVGSGRSYGLEIAGKWQQNRWIAYGSYTYSRATRIIEDINEGREYFSKFDRPSIANLMAEYRLHNRLKLIASWSFASGNPITVPISRYVTIVGDQEIVVEEYGELNNYRLPSTHHLDVAMVREKQHKKFISTLTFGVYNVYNRLNPFMAFIGLNENAEPELRLRSYLPILPTFKYSIKL